VKLDASYQIISRSSFFYFLSDIKQQTLEKKTAATNNSGDIDNTTNVNFHPLAKPV
jgi:hypothetical protein